MATKLKQWQDKLAELNEQRAEAVYKHLPKEVLAQGTPESDAALAAAQAQPNVVALTDAIRAHVADHPGEE